MDDETQSVLRELLALMQESNAQLREMIAHVGRTAEVMREHNAMLSRYFERLDAIEARLGIDSGQSVPRNPASS